MSCVPWKKKVRSALVVDSVKSLLYEKRWLGAENIGNRGAVHVVVILGKPLTSNEVVNTKRLK
jgi:hypothetical protein